MVTWSAEMKLGKRPPMFEETSAKSTGPERVDFWIIRNLKSLLHVGIRWALEDNLETRRAGRMTLLSRTNIKNRLNLCWK
ncbi:hypothetical protein ILYODFUR_014171 [Ilyodon furcidens]|uniref:Uncharacterized protein n=1 Tax=Ilyodon furcidens TaxID=33524 RepID=A0ABV0VDV0_9TELE